MLGSMFIKSLSEGRFNKNVDLFLVLRKEVAVALKYALNLGFQIHPAALQVLEELETGDHNTVIKYIVKKKTREGTRLISREDVESFLGIGQDVSLEANLVVLFDPTDKVTTAEGLSGYDALFASRFAKMKQIISARPEAKKLRTVGNVAKMSGSDNDVFVCGLVTKKSTGPDSVKIVLEDTTGSLEAWVFEEGIRTEAEMLLLDQFVMIRIGRAKNNRFVVKELVLPGIPGHAINHSETESFAVFISDLHVGSDFFMEEAFLEFVSWLSSTDQVAKRVRFVVIGGDLVDGVGIYPNQDRGLVYQTVEEQLRRAEALLSQIPQNVKVVISPGNHDPGRRALPQPAIPRKYGAGLWERENFFMVGNPCVVSLNGVKVLVFHGQSIDDIVKTTPGLSYDKPADVMKHLLRARHLSPIYGSLTPIAPEKEDMLVIEDIPDVFHVGHVHVMALEMYRGVLLVNSGAFQSQTPFQASVGLEPTPGLAAVVNLKTLEVRAMSFGSGS